MDASEGEALAVVQSYRFVVDKDILEYDILLAHFLLKTITITNLETVLLKVLVSMPR